MDEDSKVKVDWLVFESVQVRNERINKRLIIALFMSIAFLFLSNAIWLYAWLQYDYSSSDTTTTTTTKYSQDGQGINNINTGRQGDVLNGAEIENNDKNKDKNTNTNTKEQKQQGNKGA